MLIPSIQFKDLKMKYLRGSPVLAFLNGEEQEKRTPKEHILILSQK